MFGQFLNLFINRFFNTKISLNIPVFVLYIIFFPGVFKPDDFKLSGILYLPQRGPNKKISQFHIFVTIFNNDERTGSIRFSFTGIIIDRSFKPTNFITLNFVKTSEIGSKYKGNIPTISS